MTGLLEALGLRAALRLFDRAFDRLVDTSLGRLLRLRPRRQPELEIRHDRASSSSERGMAYAVVIRNRSRDWKAWDVVARALHDGEETDRALIREIDPDSETKRHYLLVPAAFCDGPFAGRGYVPRGDVRFEAHLNDRVVAHAGLAD